MTPDEEDRETLRRRLYRPGAEAADLAAYTGAAAAQQEPPPAAPPPPRRGRLVLPVLGVLTALVALGAVTATRSAPLPQRSTAAAVAETVVRTTQEERTGFIRALVAADEAGIGAWLDRHAQRLPGVLAGASRSDTLEFAGSGSRALRLDPPSIGEGGGHVTVLMVTAVDARVAWTVLGDAPDLVHGAVAGGRGAEQQAGSLTSAATDWVPGRRPGTLLVRAPAGVRWGIAAVFSE